MLRLNMLIKLRRHSFCLKPFISSLKCLRYGVSLKPKKKYRRQKMGEVVENGGAETGEKQVMVAIDESECSHYALMWVIDNLKESITTKSPLLIFMAQPVPVNNITFAASLGSARMYCPLTPELVNNIQENHRKLTVALLERAKDICATHGVTAKTITEVGDAKTAICDTVLKHNVNLLVVGERGLGKIKRAILGSVSNYCVQYAKCPVLVVKKPQVVYK